MRKAVCRRDLSRRACLVLFALAALPVRCPAQQKGELHGERLTAQRIEERAWWPTSPKPALTEYADAQACMECHETIVSKQRSTRMAHAAQRPIEGSLIPPNLHFSAAKSGMETAISSDGAHDTYSTKHGNESVTGDVLWTMGDGEIGTTFVLESGGRLFESQLSFFTALQGLDLTPGHTWEPENDIRHQFGDQLSEVDAQRCFSCHTTASSAKGRFDQTRAIPGISCQACHGPAKHHVDAMKRGDDVEGAKAIFAPESLKPTEMVDFCGACHRAPMDVKEEKDQTAINIRFQPYRLAKSRCWVRPDARLTCTACHSPHEHLVRDAASYDSKCLACHAGGSVHGVSIGKEPGCPVGSSRCVTCHMPRYQLPQLHGWFTDHFIRIVKPGEAFPL